MFTHASDWAGPEAAENCYGPYTSHSVKLCSAVTQSHLASLAQWAASTLSADARKRLVIAHIGFLSAANVDALLSAGVSVDTAARLGHLAPLGAALRDPILKYSDQIVFGSDYTLMDDCLGDGHAAWLHMLTGPQGVKKTFPACGVPSATIEVTGLGLPQAVSRNVLRDNFLRAAGVSCPGSTP